MLKACSQVGKLLSAFSSLDEAASILDFGLSTKTSLITWHAQSQQSRDEMAIDVGNIWHERGWIEHKRGLHQSATEFYTTGLDELRQLGASDSIAGCKLLRARARALVRDEPDEFFSDHCPPATDLEKALRDMQAALEILKGHGLQDTEEGAKTYNNLGLLHSLRSDFAVSAEMFEAAGRVRTLTGTLKMPMNARRLYNFGSMRLKQGRIAREALQEKAVSDAQYGPQTATEDSQFFTQAAELLREAVDILEEYEFKDDLAALCQQKLAWIAKSMSQADLPPKETRLVSPQLEIQLELH